MSTNENFVPIKLKKHNFYIFGISLELNLKDTTIVASFFNLIYFKSGMRGYLLLLVVVSLPSTY